MRGIFEPWHIVVLAVVLLMLFGSRRLPEGARALGRSLRIFKAEVKGLGSDDDAPPAASPPATATTPPELAATPAASPPSAASTPPAAPPAP
jgi:sec-independent protein translocase protein TatA